MPTDTFAITNFPWPTGKLLRARYRDGTSGATVTEEALTESPAGRYSGTAQASTTSTTVTVEIRQVATQDTAGFDAGATAFGPDFYEDALGSPLTSRALIEATGKVNADTFADTDADGDADKIQAQFDRVIADAENAARETADDAGALSLYPLATSDAQYYALQRAATDFALARLQQLRPEPVAAGKEPAGVTGERVAREKMLAIWQRVADRNTTDATLPGTFTSVPAKRTTVCDEYSCL
jgi:hypothetical protein